MAIKYKCIKTLETDNDLEQIEEHIVVADKQKTNTGLVPHAFMMFGEIIINTTLASLSYKQWKGGDETAKIIFDETMELLADGYYKNGSYFEQVANDTDNSQLFSLLGYRSYKTRESIDKAPITVFNTNILGVLLFILKAFKKVKCYNVEGTILTDGVMGTPVVFPSMPKSKANVEGFVSGALYLVRTQAIFTNGNKGDWTPYFKIRVA